METERGIVGARGALAPQPTGKKQAGRPRKSDRQMLGAILSVLRTGTQWNALPRELGASTLAATLQATRDASKIGLYTLAAGTCAWQPLVAPPAVAQLGGP